MGAYDCEDGRLVGTSCSAPITCVSNNDVPKKAPYIPIEIPVASAWPKWQYCSPQVRFSPPNCTFVCFVALSLPWNDGALAHKRRVSCTCTIKAMSAPVQCWAAWSSALLDQR